ncbi:MAG: ClbS/DfsB family four-helix bundle protein [Chloroflexota bacterium]
MPVFTDKQRLLDMLELEYEFVHRTIDDLSYEQMTEPNVEGAWSVKDIIAHLTAWMKRVLKWFEALDEERTPAIPDEGYTWQMVDTLNDAEHERDKALSLDDVLADFHDTYHAVYRLVAGLSHEALFESTFGGLVEKPMWELVMTDTFEHFQEHIIPVREWLAKNAPYSLK